MSGSLAFPPAPGINDIFQDWIWDGVRWNSSPVSAGAVVITAPNAPTSPRVNDLWFDSVGAQLYIFFDDGTSSQWIPVTNMGGGGAGVTVQDTPPADASQGALWWDTISGNLFVRYVQNGTSQWVVANGGPVGGPFLPLAGGTLSNPGNLIVEGVLSFSNPGPRIRAATGWGLQLFGNSTATTGIGIDPTGNVWVGANLYSGTIGTCQCGPSGTGTVGTFVSHTVAGQTSAMQFYWGGNGPQLGGTQVGSITNSATATAYNTSSDARLKQNFREIADCGALIDRMQPLHFDWIDAESGDGYGFSAQDMHAVFPHAVTPGVREEDTWMMDHSKLVPLLVAEIKQLRQRLRKLENG